MDIITKRGGYMRIAYLDDESFFLDHVESMFLTYLQNKPNSFSYTLFTNVDQLLFSMYDYNVFFLDIHLDGDNGVDIAKRIRNELGEVSIVFITSDPSYVFDGFKLNAVNYLLKPIQENQLFYCLDSLLDTNTDSLIIQVDGSSKRILCKEIAYIESDGHDIVVYAKEMYRFKDTLESIIDKLPNYFMRTHRSYIVNIALVESIFKEYAVINPYQIPIARNRYKDVNQAFISYNMRSK